MNLELARTKYELERANKWTQSSMIVTQLSNRTHSAKTGIGFIKKTLEKTSDLCTHCGNIGHSRGVCPTAIAHINKNIKVASKRKINHVKRNESRHRNRLVQNKKSENVLPKWINRNLIHPFDQRKGPKLVWVPKSNL